MITVRFPDGTAVEYNQANCCVVEASLMKLYTKGGPSNGGQWVASIPVATGCILEAQPPSRVFNGAKSTVEHLRLLIDSMREFNYRDSRILIELKKELANFNAKTRAWK